MQSSASGGAQSFRRERVRGAADAGSSGGGAGRAKGGSRAQDRPNVSRILDASEHDQQGSAGKKRGAHEIIEGVLPRMNQRGDPLRAFRVGEALEETVRGTQDGKSHFGPVDEGRETLVMAFPEFAEEHSLNSASGAQRLLDETRALDADESAFSGQPAAQSHTELLEPAIVAAREARRVIRGASVASGFPGGCHHRGG